MAEIGSFKKDLEKHFNRNVFKKNKTLVINLMSSPGVGKLKENALRQAFSFFTSKLHQD